MAVGDVYAYGANVLLNPSVGTTANGGQDNNGYINVYGGSMPFEPDDFIVFNFINVTPSGELQDSSAMTGFVVYETYADFVAASPPKYTYVPQNPGQTADVQDDAGGMGDTYLKFNGTSIFQSSDPGAPAMGQLLITPLIDWTVTSPSAGLQIDRNTDFDYDDSGSVDPGSIEDGDSAFNLDANNAELICFAKGTWIDTARGPRRIETLHVGTRVVTKDHGLRSIRWIGQRSVPGMAGQAPIRFAPGILGNFAPLYVSPNHRVLLSGAVPNLCFGREDVLSAAKYLDNGTTIRPSPCKTVTYYHLLLDQHHLVRSNGAWSESLYPGAETCKALPPDQCAELAELFSTLPKLKQNGPLARPVLKAAEARVFLPLFPQSPVRGLRFQSTSSTTRLSRATVPSTS